MQTALQDEAELTCACSPLFPKPAETEEMERIDWMKEYLLLGWQDRRVWSFGGLLFMFICTELFTVGLFFQRLFTLLSGFLFFCFDYILDIIQH